MTPTKEVRKTGLFYCDCGGEPEYIGNMWFDQYRCNKCHWTTKNYYGGDDISAITEWNKHQSQQKKDT